MRKGRVTDVTDTQKLSNFIDHDEGYKVTNVDRASPAYWDRKKIVFAMIRQLGCPTFFFNFICRRNHVGRTFSYSNKSSRYKR